MKFLQIIRQNVSIEHAQLSKLNSTETPASSHLCQLAGYYRAILRDFLSQGRNKNVDLIIHTKTRSLLLTWVDTGLHCKSSVCRLVLVAACNICHPLVCHSPRYTPLQNVWNL